MLFLAQATININIRLFYKKKCFLNSIYFNCIVKDIEETVLVSVLVVGFVSLTFL